MAMNEEPAETAPVVPNPPPPPRARRKLDLGIIIAGCNLLLTVCTGLVLSLYLNYRNEQFQRQLIELQNEAELANVEISYDGGQISLHNLGPGTAQDLSLVFCLDLVDTEWQRSIQDISAFDILMDNPALESRQEFKRSLCDFTFYEDAVQLSIKPLPREQSFQVRVSPSTEISVRNAEVKTNVYIIASSLSDDPNAWSGQNTSWPSSMDEFTGSPFNGGLDDYLASNEFKVADIELNLACSNCTFSTEKLSFPVSSFRSKELRDIAFDNSTSDRKIYVRINNQYNLPGEADPEPRDDLYLTAKVERNGQVTIARTDKFEFSVGQIPTPTIADIFPQGDGGEENIHSFTDNPVVIEDIYRPECAYSGTYGIELGYHERGRASDGWIVRLKQPMDVSAYTAFKFWSKGTPDNQRLQIRLIDANDNEATFESESLPIITADWSRVAVSLSNFQGLDLSSLQSVDFILEEFQGSGTICIDEVAFE